MSANNLEIPNFIYVNKFAISCFKYTEAEMLSLHSYLSAAPDAQEERNKILKQVQENNIAFDYSGIRLTKFKKPFTINDGIIWKIFKNGNHGEVIGQAALFWLKDEPKPDWWKILK
ncbi:MEKHLA domain-containing protein [Chryseobacterium arachidis]|uniref:MEKHLA domain-containing protein n=1 Tax=Chryseobacterium arachidis TaxID=1416778 RepID=UPI0036164555